jgi:hypothetical protein
MMVHAAENNDVAVSELDIFHLHQMPLPSVSED